MNMRGSVGCFEAAWLFIWNLIKNSFTYRIIRRLYDIISGAWRGSVIAQWFRQMHIDEDALGKTVAGRVVRSPFTFIEFLQKKCGESLSKLADRSFFVNLCRIYLNNIMALNLRFIGLMIAGGVLGYSVCKTLGGGGLGAISIGTFVVGALLSLINRNVTDWLKSSGIVRLVCRLLDLEADFNWYDEKYTVGRGRAVLAAIFGIAVGVVGGKLGLIFAAAAVIGLAGALLIIKSPAVGACALIFIAPIAPTMIDVALSLLCIFSLIVYAVTHKGFRFKFDGMGFLLIILIGVYLLAAFKSFAPIKSISIWAIYFVFISIYFVIINSVNSEKLLNNILTCFVISGFFVCLYGIAQYVFGWDTNQAWMDEQMFEDIKMRIYSTLDNPNVLGEYILLVLPVSVGLMWTRKGAPAKIVYAGISALMFGALILTFSRGCWVGLLAAAAVFITFAAGKLWGLGLLALPIIPMVLPKSIINRFTSIGDMEDSSTSYRVYIWMGTLAMLKDFWVSGIGMGQEAFTQVYPFYSYNGVVAPHSHNLFLQILVESGIVGIIIFIAFVVLFLRRMMTGYQYGGKGAPLSTLITAVSAALIGFLLQGMFDNCFYNYRVMLIFWCTAALGRACVYVAKQRGDASK